VKPSIQEKLMRVIFSLLASAVLLLALASNAKADTVNSLQMKGLGNYIGKYLTVYYALGSRAVINTEGDQVRLRSVKSKMTVQITNDIVTLPAINLPRSGFILPYNIIVFSIHNTADFRWVNADGTIPDGEITTGATQSLSIDSLTKVEFESMQQSHIQNYQYGEDKASLSDSL